MLAPIIPIDPLDRALDRIVRLLPLAEASQLDATFQLPPVARMRTLMAVIMSAAKRDPEVVEILRTPELLPTLKTLAKESEQVAEQEPERAAAA